MKTKISLVLALVTISAVPAWAASNKQLGGASKKTASASRSAQSGSKIWLPQNQPPRLKSQPSKSPDPTIPPKKPPVRQQLVGRAPLIIGNGGGSGHLMPLHVRDHRPPTAGSSFSGFGTLASAPPPVANGGGGVTVTVRPSQR